MKNKMRKIYNKIIIGWNETTQRYDDVLQEDSFMYDGEIEEAMAWDDDGVPDVPYFTFEAEESVTITWIS